MPTVDCNGVTLRYAVAGEGPTVAFVNDVGVGAWLWSYVQPGLTGPYETVVWDLRGTGDSDAPAGPYTIETLVADLAAVLGAVDARRVHLVGAGLGGVIALEYARRHARAASVVALATADGGAVDADAVSSLAAPRDDREALRDSLAVGFAPGVPDRYPDAIDRIVAWRARDDADPAAWDAQLAAWLGASIPDRYGITTPTLAMSGEADRIVDPEATARLADELPRARHERIEGGHLFPVSESQVVVDELLGWLDERTD